jgi:hypothetical protein
MCKLSKLLSNSSFDYSGFRGITYLEKLNINIGNRHYYIAIVCEYYDYLWLYIENE